MATLTTSALHTDWIVHEVPTARDWAATAALARDALAFYKSPTAPELLEDARLIAHQLPLKLRRAVLRLRQGGVRAVVITGQGIDDAALGPTPTDWRIIPDVGPTAEHELLLLLYGSLLGDAFTWGTRQNGRLINDLLPVPGHEHEQIGTSSETELAWHTEDAFHPHRPDYLALMCLRNPDRVGTTMAPIDAAMVTPSVLEILFQERFVIHPDTSHVSTPGSSRPAAQSRLGDFQQRFADPKPVAVLFGAKAEPFARLDPDFTVALDDDALAAFTALSASVEPRLIPLSLEAGEACLFDNHRVVHGRAPFRARYDGTDRWLKRLMVSTDLNRSRAFRSDARSRQTY